MKLLVLSLLGLCVLRPVWFIQLRSGALSARRRAPRFMLELYDAAAARARGSGRTAVKSITGQSDEARHFFNLSSFLRHDELLVKAEFRWFRRAPPFLPRRHFYKVDLCEIPDSSVKPWRGRLIGSRLMPAYTSRWEVFNITHTVTKWIFNSNMNNGILVVSILPAFETVMQTRRATMMKNDVYLVIYSESDGSSGQSTESQLEFLQYRDSLQNPVHRRKRREPQFVNDGAVPCHRTHLYVDFEKIGWSGWIISPRGYHAYLCAGSCPFPLSGTLRATNHAIVQSIVNALKLSNKVEQPCCVPDVLHPISLLYFDDEENVVLKQYDDMVVGSCGCH